MQRANRRKYHYIYKITRFDGRYYIGMHSTENLDDGYFGSGKLITRSIKKHGAEKHTKEILEYLPCRISLKEREKQIINEDIINDVKCMNLQLGGGGGWGHNLNSLLPFRDPEIVKWRNKIATETIKKRREDEEYRKAYAKKLSDAAKGKMPFLGKKHSQDTRIKMAYAKIGKYDGENNPNFGKKNALINKDGIRKRISHDLLEIYLIDGWVRGMK